MSDSGQPPADPAGLRLSGNGAFLQALIDAVPDGLRVVDRETFRIVAANRAYGRLVGREPAAIVGMTCHAVSRGLDAPCPATLCMCPVAEMKARPDPVKSIQRLALSGGGERHVESVAAPLELEIDGRRRTLMVESIRDLARDVRFSHEQRLSAIGQLAAGIAHEVRNPLSSVRMALQGALRRLGEADGWKDQELANYLRIVERQIEKCLTVTDRLLQLSMPPGSRPELVEVGAAVDETLSLLAAEAERRGILVATELPAGGVRVLASESDLRMVILNLAQNAFHAMPNGGALDVAARAGGGEVVIEVADRGTGIAADALPHIFDPFFSRRADGKAGSGLGLTICRSIVERWRGRIEVAARPGGGTVFTVVLPAARPSSAGG
jgi:signal transduction histidine kinase